MAFKRPVRHPVGRQNEVRATDNVFAMVVMAQIRAKAGGDAETRRAWKFRLIRLMHDRGYARQTILELFRVIDWTADSERLRLWSERMLSAETLEAISC